MIISGIQPSGKLHIGNYFGAIKTQIELSKKEPIIILIADYHALTTISNPEELNNNVYEILKTYLALGFGASDCGKSLIIRQSSIPEIHELAWILSTVCGTGLLNHAHAYKSKIDNNEFVTVGTYNYPILMAADILLLGSAKSEKINDSSIFVPVGSDQHQHIEIAQQLATSFNEKFAKNEPILKIPQALVSSTPLVIGIDGRKMSKSYGNTIPIIANETEIRKIVSKIVTDSKPLGSVLDFDNCNIVTLMKLFGNDEKLNEVKIGYENGTIGYGHAKKILSDVIVEYFLEVNLKYKKGELSERKIVGEGNLSLRDLDQLLIQNTAIVREMIQSKLNEIRKAVGLFQKTIFYFKK